jgi:bifunctional non-homologous end joining protein LigD
VAREKAFLKNLPSGRPEFIEPMQCKLVPKLPEGEDWLYELKFDGYRALAIKDNKIVRLISRNNKVLNSRYPELVTAVGQLPFESIVLDGEIVALDENGLPSFQKLQNLSAKTADRNLSFFAFDILNLEKHKLLNLPLMNRKELLKSILPEESLIRYSFDLHANLQTLIREVRKSGIEGLVAKRKNSRYEPGRRSGSWMKFKLDQEQEFVIGGFRPSGISGDFELLLIGYFENQKLYYVAKLKSGFTPHIKREIRSKIQNIVTKACPFVNLPESHTGRWGEGLTDHEMDDYIWVKPRVVCRVQFVEWTPNNHLRHAKFVALRDDKKAKDVIREDAG